MRPEIEDIAAMREQGDLKDYLLSLIAQAPAAPKPKPHLVAVPEPAYRIAHTGAWPIGTAVTGPTPPPGACTCPHHQHTDTTRRPQEGAA
ncbi:hypothetical protein [Streptomyces sp. SID8499]|uniref:hypothetical protein n=1 Tax=Streptomyces sp. SID8499 TaxID=2706106 RepID=UPI0013C98479|nr:hypothetical protein [Streptomyces sp. SID8499]NED31040.1 hypothetical protein [Streptomyces sp. SID8499]